MPTWIQTNTYRDKHKHTGAHKSTQTQVHTRSEKYTCTHRVTTIKSCGNYQRSLAYFPHRSEIMGNRSRRLAIWGPGGWRDHLSKSRSARSKGFHGNRGFQSKSSNSIIKKLLALFAICLKAKCLFSVRNLSKTWTIQVDCGQCFNEKWHVH